MLLHILKTCNFNNVIFMTCNIAAWGLVKIASHFGFDVDDYDADDDSLLKPVTRSLAQRLIMR